jgi:hypothetical protein
MFNCARKWIVVLCLVAVLCAALTSATSGLLVAILIPLSFLFFVLVRTPLCLAAEPRKPARSPFVPVFASRPPPAW